MHCFIFSAQKQPDAISLHYFTMSPIVIRSKSAMFCIDCSTGLTCAPMGMLQWDRANVQESLVLCLRHIPFQECFNHKPLTVHTTSTLHTTTTVYINFFSIIDSPSGNQTPNPGRVNARPLSYTADTH